MPRALLAIILVLAVVSGLIPGGPALGSIESPSARSVATAQAKASDKAPAKNKILRKINSYYTDVRDGVLAKLRPVERQDNIDFNGAEKALSSKTTLQKIFDNDFERKMREEYAKKVSPYEATATDPVWRARAWETKRYNDGQKDLASWTTREVLDDQLNNFVNGGDQSSAPMKVLSTAHKLSGGEDRDDRPAKMTEEQKIARAHRTDLPPLPAEEESIPTKLKTKINIIKTTGSVVFTNPIAIASVNGSKDDGVSVGMDREFRKLTMKSNLTYGVNQECLNFNLNKKISDRVSLDLDHASYTGGKRGSTGEKSREQAKVNYSLSF